MSDAAIRAERISKRYNITMVRQRHPTLRDQLAEGFRNFVKRNGGSAPPGDVIWALRDVSFEIGEGEAVGIIGRNGAGKTTLLKVLSRITEPTRGRAEIRGRVGSLLEVGTGFHPELTGRENIYLNGALLGMRKREIARKFDEIVAFAETGAFIDTPVKRYSTGMSVRLAFAVAAHLEPEILIVDEVLAVGDAAFQRKCLGKMGDVARQGRTVLLVSHNMGAIGHLCRRAMWIDSGQLKLTGPASDVVTAYLRSQVSGNATWERSQETHGGSRLRLLSARVLKMDGSPTSLVDFRDPFDVEIVYRVLSPLQGCAIAMQIVNGDGFVVLESSDRDTTELEAEVRKVGIYRSLCRIPGGLLRDGRYFLRIIAFIEMVAEIDRADDVLSFEVSPLGSPARDGRRGIVAPVLDWAVELREGEGEL